MEKHFDYWRKYHTHLTNDDLVALLIQKAQHMGADNMGVPDGILLEAAYRLEKK